MLEMSKTKVVGFIQVAEAAPARDFYGRVLGLTLKDDGYALIAEFNGAKLRITTVPNFVAPPHPAFGFIVPDAHAFAVRLASQGVALERFAYLGEAQGADGVWTGPDGSKVVWFKDSDGNLLIATSEPA